ncbi:MAG TPA: hypothetical protein VFB72_19955 [Verrucomicrobiae bacterium]|nr:hypothetical protein [Verrucomicrobiae bacterium]
MKVEVFCLSDYAQVDSAGKLTIVGIFDTVYAIEAPTSHGLCALAARIRFAKPDEDGLKKFRISFSDADGKLLLPPWETQMPIATESDTSPGTVHIVAVIQQIRLPNFGEYTFELWIDEVQVASAPLWVRPTTAMPDHLRKKLSTS